MATSTHTLTSVELLETVEPLLTIREHLYSTVRAFDGLDRYANLRAWAEERQEEVEREIEQVIDELERRDGLDVDQLDLRDQAIARSLHVLRNSRRWTVTVTRNRRAAA